jgi:formylmethanofuran dehydrogenase subunit C
MKLANLLRNNFFKFLPLKESLNSYIKTVIEAYLKYTDLAKYLEIEEIREFNMVVKLKNIFDVSQDDFFDNVLIKEEADKYYMMKAYLISEFAIAIVE